MLYRCLPRSSGPRALQCLGRQQFSSARPTFLSQAATDELDESSEPLKNRNHESPLRKVGSHIALRDACKCPKCVDPSTLQRDFHFADIPVSIKGEATKISDGKSWEVRWINDIPGFDNHVSVFTEEQIERLLKPTANYHRSTIAAWDLKTFRRETEKLKFPEFMRDDNVLALALHQLARHGLFFVADVPRDAESCLKLAERIAPVRNTFYGQTWDVKSKPQAKNVAYTSKYLGFHTDLMYMNESPCIQLLHCIDNSCDGGESRYVDGLKALDILATENPEMAQTLADMQIRYEYDNDGHYYSRVKPVVTFQARQYYPRRFRRGLASPLFKYATRINWSPQFVGSILPEDGDRSSMKDKITAAKAFSEILERPELVYEEKVEPGTCAIFNNQRVLHARNAFDVNSGERWLRGCYLDEQDVLSKELSLSDKIGRLESGMARRLYETQEIGTKLHNRSKGVGEAWRKVDTTKQRPRIMNYPTERTA